MPQTFHDAEASIRFLTNHSAAQGQALGTAHNALMLARAALAQYGNLEFEDEKGRPVREVIDEAIEAIVS